MGIGQTRDNRFAAEINCSRGVKFLRVFIGTDENDAVLLDRDRFGMRLFFINRVNISVNQQKIDFLSTADL